MENRLWEKGYNLRASDFDTFNRVKLSSVLDLFQDAAGQHAIQLGVGFEDMIARSYMWVLVRIKLEIIAQPKPYERVMVKTWPLEPNRLIYRREYAIESMDGERLVVGSSEWVVMHSERRRLVKAPDLYPFSDNFYPERNFEERLDRVEDFTSTAVPYVITPGFSEIDRNGHVNNTKYANYVLDAINPCENDEIEIFQIDFRKEVLRGTSLNIYHEKNDEIILARGENADGEIMFACKLKLRSPKI